LFEPQRITNKNLKALEHSLSLQQKIINNTYIKNGHCKALRQAARFEFIERYALVSEVSRSAYHEGMLGELM
jgi:hypothetical protein